MRFTFEVVETQLRSRTYVVEADDIDSARNKAAIGDTVSESDLSTYPDVVGREVMD